MMSDIVSLLVTHSELKTFCPELRFELSKSVSDVKHQLSKKCGTEAASMRLVLKDNAQVPVYDALEDERLLGYYSPSDGFWLHIVDLNPASTDWIEDLSQVEKYTMPDEQYDKLENSFRAFKRRMTGSTSEKEKDSENDVEVKCDINIGERCQVDPGDKRGIVKFVGKVPQLKSGIWIGIEYDEPVGKNDGTIQGEKVFDCAAQHGAFVRPPKVRVGHFPPLDDFADEI